MAAAVLTAGALGLAAAVEATPAGAQTTFYAYATGAGTPAGCPQSSTPADECSLATALSDVAAGEVVALATPGSAGSYVGNWTVDTSSTSATDPVAIEPASGVADPTLSGNSGAGAGCTTASCEGSVLDIENGTSVTIEGVTIEHGDEVIVLPGTGGGAIDTGNQVAGGTVRVIDDTFLDNKANWEGGAIDNGDNGGGTLVVTDSTFSGNNALNGGGAIDNGDHGGSGTLEVAGSTFSGNTAGDGGAIDNGDSSVSSSTNIIEVAGSTFSGNTAGDGGAIDNGDDASSGTNVLEVTGSTFSGNVAASGPVIANGAGAGAGTVAAAAADVFDGSCANDSSSPTSWDDEGYNVGSDDTCFSSTPATGDTSDADLSGQLGSLTDNGGSTDTIALSSGNPAIDLVPSTFDDPLSDPTEAFCSEDDQRGTPRLASGATSCDAGAYELVVTESSGGTASPARASQVVTFTSSPPAAASVGGTYTPAATASSGLPVVFSSVTTSVCTVSADGTVDLVAAGTCAIVAEQAGDGGYQPALATQSFSVLSPPSPPPPPPSPAAAELVLTLRPATATVGQPEQLVASVRTAPVAAADAAPGAATGEAAPGAAAGDPAPGAATGEAVVAGEVRFSVGKFLLCKAAVSEGEAACTARTFPRSGRLVLHATYSGTTGVQPAHGRLPVSVRTDPVVLTGTVRQPGAGPVRYTATIRPVHRDFGPTRGSVSFGTGATTLCSARVVGETASCDGLGPRGAVTLRYLPGKDYRTATSTITAPR